MINPKSKTVHAALHVAPFLTFFCALAVLVMVWQSYIGYFPPPVVVTNMSGNMLVDANSTTLIYERVSNVRLEVASQISRRIICNEHWVYEFKPSDQDYDEAVSGKVMAYNERIPFRIPPNTVCVLKTTATYHPPLSLRDHTYPVPDIVMRVEGTLN